MLRPLLCIALFFGPFHIFSQNWVESISPAPNAIDVPSLWELNVKFSEDLDPLTLTSANVIVYGHFSGYDDPLTISYDATEQTATIKASRPFWAGEKVSISLTQNIKNTNGDSIPEPFSWDFLIKTSQSNGQMIQSRTEQVGSVPYSLAAIDLEGDGDLDLVTGNRGNNTISFLVNDGMGNFVLSGQQLSVGNLPEFIVAGDWDHDGDADLATVNAGDENVSLLRNNGSGIFSPNGTVSVGLNPHTLNTGDLDGDGDLELIASNFNGNSLSVLVNDGSGNFTSGATPPVGMGPEQPQIGDWDGDGDRDMAVSHFSGGSVSVLENKGTGWGSFGTINTGNLTHLPGSGDLNGDGAIDLLAPASGSNQVYLLYNDGMGGFSSSNLPIQGGPWSVIAGDFHGDGMLDFGVVRRNVNQVSVYKNRGGAGFQLDKSYGTSSSPHQLIAADFNGDQALDLAVANDGASSVTILLNTPTTSLWDGEFTLLWYRFVAESDQPFLKIGIERPAVMEIKLWDIQGREVFRINKRAKEGIHSFRLPASLGKGMYAFQIQAFGEIWVGKWANTISR